MTPTVDVEITSTTVRATLADTEVPAMELEAPDSTALSEVVHKFLHALAKEQDTAVEVVYCTGTHTRYLRVRSLPAQRWPSAAGRPHRRARVRMPPRPGTSRQSRSPGRSPAGSTRSHRCPHRG